MKKNKKILRLVCGMLCLCMCLSACRKNDNPTTAAVDTPKDAIYTISVKTAGGMPFAGLVAYVYEDATEDDLVTFGTLDENGSFTFTATESDKYTVRIPNLPAEGYDVQPYYAITDTNTEIVLTSSVVTGKDALEAGKKYELGDVMRDFTVTTVDGQELKLSEILKDKEAVVLNFWFTNCNPCKNEFPYLQAAYEAYSDKIEVITMNPIDNTGDDVASIIAFRDAYGLTMPMATCSSQWLEALGVAQSGYPTTVAIDRYGVICLFAGAVDEEGVFEAAFEHFTAENYQQKLIANIYDLYNVEYEVGHAKNPLQVHGGMESFAVTVPGNAEYHVALFRGDGLTLRLEDPNVYLIIDDVRYEPNSKGFIEVEITNPDVTTSTNIIIGNTGVTPTDLQVQLILPKGTFSNPYEAKLGANKVTVEAGNAQGVYYTWTAAEDGMLTVTVTSNPKNDYDIQLYNLNTYAVRNLTEKELIDEDGNRYVSVAVNQGDVVSIGYMSVPDASYNYPEVTIKSEISFAASEEENPKYTLTFQDDSGNPISDVKVTVSVDGVDTVFVSDGNGLIEMELPAGSYVVRVTVPEGYVCETTQFLLSADTPTKTIVMAVYVPQQLQYTVFVVDEAGNPIPNAAVVIGSSYLYTDETGMASAILVESKDYVATVTVPEGYYLENSTYAFGEATTLTVVAKQMGEEIVYIDYTVKVVGMDGKAFTDVTVNIIAADGTEVASQAVDADGKLVVNLPEGSYTVTLTFTGNYGYEASTAKLSASDPSTTIKVAPMWDNTTETLYTEDVALNLETGSVYVDLTGKDIQYFVFTPTKSGIYTFTTTNSCAVVGYWGSPTYIYSVSLDENIKNNVLTLEVKEPGPTYILSVSGGEGISGTIVTIKRTGSVAGEPERVDYEGTTTPTKTFVVTEGGTKTYFDLSVAHTIVKGSDGYYHYGSEEGRIVYMDLKNARFGISIAAVVDTSPMFKYEFDSNGDPIKRIDYTNCMISYVKYADEAHGVYALTDDLITMIQEHGKQAGWFDSNGQGYYLFEGENVLAESAWMFLLCVFD